MDNPPYPPSDCPKCKSQSFTTAHLGDTTYIHKCDSCDHRWNTYTSTDSPVTNEEEPSPSGTDAQITCPYCHKDIPLGGRCVPQSSQHWCRDDDSRRRRGGLEPPYA